MASEKQYNELLLKFGELKNENDKLIKEQKEFQNALAEKIEALKKLGPWKRFWGYWKLVMDLITTIEEAISKSNNN